MKTIAVNLNNQVTVKLTPFGKNTLLNLPGDQLVSLSHGYKGKDGTLRLQLWEFAQYFGVACHMGGEPVCKNNVIYLELDENQSPDATEK